MTDNNNSNKESLELPKLLIKIIEQNYTIIDLLREIKIRVGTNR